MTREESSDRVVPFLLAAGEQVSLRALHLANQDADAIHRRLAAVGSDEGEGAVGVAGAPQLNRLIQLLHLLGGELLERLDPPLLLRVVMSVAVMPKNRKRFDEVWTLGRGIVVVGLRRLEVGAARVPCAPA